MNRARSWESDPWEPGQTLERGGGEKDTNPAVYLRTTHTLKYFKLVLDGYFGIGAYGRGHNIFMVPVAHLKTIINLILQFI